jgi:hypothetical protein
MVMISHDSTIIASLSHISFSHSGRNSSKNGGIRIPTTVIKKSAITTSIPCNENNANIKVIGPVIYFTTIPQISGISSLPLLETCTFKSFLSESI